MRNILNFTNYRLAFSEAAILINASQKSYLKTPEELRMLPALLQGVVVITESNPNLKELPYRDFLIECSVESFSSTVLGVVRSYEETWSAVFEQVLGRDVLFREKVVQLSENNRSAIESLLT